MLQFIMSRSELSIAGYACFNRKAIDLIISEHWLQFKRIMRIFHVVHSYIN